jgi:hypothetical protein
VFEGAAREYLRMVDRRLSRLRETILERLAFGFAHDELSPHTHEVRVQVALAAGSLRELRDVTWDLSAVGDVLIGLLVGAVDGVEVVADGRWLASDASHVSWVLGRASSCDVRFGATSVSRRHAVVTKRGRCWSLQDLGAKNGTWVNEERVYRRRLRPGDRIELGADAGIAVLGERHLRWRMGAREAARPRAASDEQEQRG